MITQNGNAAPQASIGEGVRHPRRRAELGGTIQEAEARHRKALRHEVAGTGPERRGGQVHTLRARHSNSCQCGRDLPMDPV